MLPRHAVLRAVLIASMALQGFVAAQPAHELGETSPVTRLLQRWGDDPSMADADLRRALTELGPESLEEMISVLADRRYAAPPIEDRAATFTLDPRQATALIDATLDLPRWAVRQHLEGIASSPGAHARRQVGLQLVAEWGTPREAGLALALAGASPREAPLDRDLRRALMDSLTRLVRREAATLFELRALTDGLALEPLLCVVQVLGTLGEPMDVQHLARIAHEVPQTASVAMVAIGRLAARHPAPFAESANRHLRERLARSTGPELLQTIRTTAALEDVKAFPLLLDLLDSEVPAIGEAAHDALVAVSRKSLPPESSTWRRWYAVELAWWVNSAPERFTDLSSGEAEREARAIHDLAGHELFRHQTAARLGEYLLTAPHQRAALCCAALGHLRSGSALPHLNLALERPESLIQRTANEALRRIQGLAPIKDRRSL